MDIHPGQSFPLGATVYPDGVNFCVFSKNSVAMELLLFDEANGELPSKVIYLEPRTNRTFYYWHVFVSGVGAGQLYGYRAYGPFAPERGHRFDGRKVLLDPYARAVAVGKNYSRKKAACSGDNAAHAMKGVVVDNEAYDWEGDQPLNRPFLHTVIYELHVGGFTRHASSGVSPEKRGTYAGLIEKIPYLKELGITAVELLPVQQFDEQDANTPLKNYWGYSPVAFFAPHGGYSSIGHPLGPVDEFRDLVKAMHREGIEVILDVVFNHTAEGNHLGPTLSFRGLENRAYYILEPDRTYYANYSGTGNTVNANHSIVRRMILDCLRYWVAEMHVDGFRFDLASVLSRDEMGRPLETPPIVWEIESDPVLAGTKVIAEAWDAGGLYQVGSFVGHKWAEWNGHFRDDVRRFVKGDPGLTSNISARVAGSPDLYRQQDREPGRTINFVTCHDGFTLNDLVSYNEKNNEENGEQGRDGTDANFSWNCGTEGATDDEEIEGLRLRQIKNSLTILLLSHGTPMLLMGDEVRRTQKGNNNAYCQDNETSWFDWTSVEKHVDILRFVRHLIRLKLTNPVFQEERFWTDKDGSEEPRIVWHGVHLGQPDWSSDARSLAFTLRRDGGDNALHVMLNAYWEGLDFDLPPLPRARGKIWTRIVDTSLPTPQDVSEPQHATRISEASYHVGPRSTVVLMTQTTKTTSTP